MYKGKSPRNFLIDQNILKIYKTTKIPLKRLELTVKFQGYCFAKKKKIYFTHENYQNIKYPKNTQKTVKRPL